MDIDMSAQTTAAQSSGIPDTNALYCEECLRVDRSLHDLPNSTLKDKYGDLRLSLTTGPGNIREDTTCPSCRDLLNFLDVKASGKTCFDVALRTSFRNVECAMITMQADAKSSETIHNCYLLRRSMYSMQLRNDFPASAKANNLPMGLVKSWLNTCEREHECCRSSPAGKLNMTLYLIDVLEECITLMPDSEVRYMALSYVWGNVESTKLTSRNIEALKMPQSLSSNSQIAIVPQTIRDAMLLAAGLGSRYLWVDCLCLIQDDSNMAFYLDRMHLIYLNAYLTIVVANKDNAGSGISGYETRSSGRTLPGTVIRYPNHVLGIHENAGPVQNLGSGFPWSSRGWTLQEGFFSRRALVVGGRVGFKCLDHYQEEEEEGTNWGIALTSKRSVEMRSLLRPLCGSYVEAGVMGLQRHIALWSLYADIVNAYASRTLSYDTDVMRAFSGVMSFFRRPDYTGSSPNTELFYGHPVITLPNSLLWSSPGFHLRRRILPPHQNGSPVVPSWSWMAWQHSAGSGIGDFMREKFNYPRYIDLDTPTAIHAHCGTCLRNHKVTDQRCKNILDLERFNQDYHDPYLYISAQRARLYVFPHPQTKYSRSEYLYSSTNEEGDIVGEVRLDHQPPKHFLDKLMVLDFVGMCRFDYGEEESINSLVHALCIKPADDRPGMFDRLGVATIRKGEWDQVAQFDDNIVLG